MDHLVGTCGILQSWGCEYSICAAGMFHSIYGTNAFGFQCLGAQDRDLVVRMVGVEAEQLIYLFCISRRPGAFLEAVDSNVLTHRRTGQAIRVDAATAWALIKIECANLMEQGADTRFLGDVVAKSDVLDDAGLGRQALGDIASYLDECAKKLSVNA